VAKSKLTVSVVNSYAADSEAVCVILLSNVDLEIVQSNGQSQLEDIHTFPTEGKPIKAIRASPDFWTSNPVPLGPDFEVGSSSWAR